ncbi:MAG: HD-GYP domain-containing protein [bacterium]
MAANKKVELIVNLVTAISNCALYSVGHPIVRSLAEKSASLLKDLMGENDSYGIMVIANELVFDQEPLRDKSLHIATFVKKIRKKGVTKLTFKKEVPAGEIVKLINDIADPAAVVSQYPHISTGLVEVRIGDANLKGISADELAAFQDEQMGKVKGVFSGVSRFKQLDIAGLEDIIINFVTVMHREANILSIMTPVRSYSEFTYTHATNVAVLSLFQAEALGMKGDYLHEIGIAALLHDVGKMFIATEILEKKGKLDQNEWEEMKKHTVYGAKYLIGIDGAPKIAVPAALEHHMGYDGSGYPETNFLKRKQHLCSQIIAVSDCYDALRAKRPYKKDYEIVDILAILRQGAGEKKYNPVLVDHFIRNLTKTISFREESKG